MSVGKRKEDPYLNFRFLLEIDGLIRGGFSEVSGLQVEVDTEDYQEGGVNDFVHKLPKGARHQNLVLKRGMTDSGVLWKWHEDVINGKIEFKSGRIIILDYEGTEKVHWRFKDAFPVKWVGPDFRADGNNVAIETLELIHKGFQRG
jgi:phage tail-like protein